VVRIGGVGGIDESDVWQQLPSRLLRSSLRLSVSARKRLSHDLSGQAKRGFSRRDAEAQRRFGRVVSQGFAETTRLELPLCLLRSSLRLNASARERLSHDLAGQAKRGILAQRRGGAERVRTEWALRVRSGVTMQ